MVDRAERALSDDDIAKIAGTFHAWRGITSPPELGAPAPELVEGPPTPVPEPLEGPYTDVPGFAYSATLAEIKAADYALTPGRYVGAADVEDDGEPIDEKLARLRAALEKQFAESARLAEVVREQLGRVS
jgi:type I restriction enzyme M protein